ncbi:hypothetical protein N566_24790, partial [Streptomycetaceae bacterium MP113-05]
GAPPGQTDPYTRALRSGRGPLYLRRTDGRLLPLDVERWCAHADRADRDVLRRCPGGPVLDVGCGPGRMVAALAASGRTALGVDTAPMAVRRTRALGAPVLLRSVFDPLPGEGRWAGVLLMDGNIGIGGDPGALLARVAGLLAPGGVLLVEAVPEDVEEQMEVCLDDGDGGRSATFRWARLGPGALRQRAEDAGWSVTEQWSTRGRPFLALNRGLPPGGCPPGTPG